MYLGFSQLPLGIGWVVEGYYGQVLYAEFGAKETVARQSLLDGGLSQGEVNAIPFLLARHSRGSLRSADKRPMC